MCKKWIYLNIIKAIYDNSTVNITLNGGELKTFLLRSGKRQECPTLPFLLTVVLNVLTRVIKQEKQIKSIRFGEEEIKLWLIANDMVLYIENCKDSIKKNLRTNE